MNARLFDETLHSRNQDPITPIPPFLESGSFLESDGQTSGEDSDSTIRFSRAITKGVENTFHPYHPDPVTPLPFIEELRPFASSNAEKAVEEVVTEHVFPIGFSTSVPTSSLQNVEQGHSFDLSQPHLSSVYSPPLDMPSKKQEIIASASSLNQSMPFPSARNWDGNERKSSPRYDLPRPAQRGQRVRRLWLIIGLTCLVVFSSVIGTFLFVLPPTLSLSDGNKVIAGEVLHLHGSNFVPASNVTLTLDNGSPLLSIGTKTTQKVQHEIQLGVSLITALQMPVTGQVAQATAPNTAIPVRSTGSFDVDLVLNDSFPLGMHTIHAVEAVFSRSATLNFTVVPKLAKLTLQTSALDFGKPEKGLKIILPIIIENTGDQLLSWIADTGGTVWLKLSISAGTMRPGREQIIYVTADTSHLALRAYTATLDIKSNGGSAVVEARLVVIPPIPHKQAKLSVNPSALGFGRIVQGKWATLVVTVGNIGDLALSWRANEAGTNWLTLDRSSGVIQPGGVPQTIQATANTSQLAPGNYSQNLQITSSGGQATVGITLVVDPACPICVIPTPTPSSTPTSTPTSTPSPTPTDTPTPTPSPTPSPTPTPPVLTVTTPSSLDPSQSQCSSSNGGNTYQCTVTLEESPDSQENANWMANSGNGANFSPPNGPLSPGNSVTITITGIACQNDTFTFSGQEGETPVSVVWSCTATPTPTDTPTPTP